MHSMDQQPTKLQPILYKPGSLQLLDQRLLPTQFLYLVCAVLLSS